MSFDFKATADKITGNYVFKNKKSLVNLQAVLTLFYRGSNKFQYKFIYTVSKAPL